MVFPKNLKDQRVLNSFQCFSKKLDRPKYSEMGFSKKSKRLNSLKFDTMFPKNLKDQRVPHLIWCFPKSLTGPSIFKWGFLKKSERLKSFKFYMMFSKNMKDQRVRNSLWCFLKRLTDQSIPKWSFLKNLKDLKVSNSVWCFQKTQMTKEFLTRYGVFKKASEIKVYVKKKPKVQIIRKKKIERSKNSLRVSSTCYFL